MKMSVRNIAVKNTFWVIFRQLITIIMQFASRKVFLTYLGVELVGINTTLTSVISAAALAESGINSVIIFHLYIAIQNKDEEDINSLISISKIYLRFVGIFMICASLVMLPFVKHFLSGIVLTPTIYVYFMLICASSAASYFLAYKRLLLSADRRAFVCDIVDSLCNVVFTIAKIVFLIVNQSYLMFLLLTIFQTVVSNILVQIVCQKLYPFLRKRNPDYTRLKGMLSEIRELFMGALSAYFYNASDNVIISKFISTAAVGFVGNYTTITAGLKKFALSAVSVMSPILGNKAAEKGIDRSELKNVFLFFDYMLYCIAAVIVVPEFVLIQDFVKTFWGSDYIMTISIPLLLLCDQYIVLVQDSNGIMLSTTGHFKELKIADGTAAITNFILSILFAKPWGISGVFIATVISRMMQWLIKAYYSHIHYWKETKLQFVKYWLKKAFGFAAVVGSIAISSKCYVLFGRASFIFRFVLGGITSIFISAMVSILVGALSGSLANAVKIIMRKNNNYD